MDDKMFELMTKMYCEFSEFRKDMNEFRKDTKNDIIRLENNLDTNSKALFDGYKQTFEKIVTIESTLNDISDKIEKQDVEIRVIKGGNKAKAK